ncbi:MAG: alpha/beta hydrolase [Acidobacteria bacterium]|nr:alpha/beta hydrolase [Acidobacteriota bacterium]
MNKSPLHSLQLIIISLTFLMCVHDITAGVQNVTSQPPLPPPGKLVDIGGWRLHLNCTGEVRESQPTVILEAGAGSLSVEWSLTQPGVAGFARVCSYDRAGIGWSDLGPHPRTMRQVVFELHSLLEKAGVRPPYVLVGSSYGGVLAQLYAATYPTDVAGMLLVDSGMLNPFRYIDGKLVRLADTARGIAVPPVKTSNPLRESDIPPGARAQIEAAARQSAPGANQPPRDKLPVDAQRMRAWALSQVKHYAAHANQFEAEELALMLTDQKKKEHPLGEIPLIVLTAGRSEFGPDEQALEEERSKDQASLANLSRKGKQVIAVGSGHHIQIEVPDLVVKSIREVVTAARK